VGNPDRPLFSIILPVCDRAELVAEALDSVLGQSMQDFEVIVVDDGSTDRTPEVLSRYADRARLLHQSNSGSGVARNLALAKARGEYAVFLDSDDLLPPWTLEIYAGLIESQSRPSILLNVPAHQRLDRPVVALQPAPLEIETGDDFLAVARDRSHFKGSALPVAKVQALRSVGGFTTKAIAFEDWDLMLRLGITPGVVTVISPALLIYRHHGATETRNPMHLVAGALHCLAQERADRYPGGRARRRERRTILSSLCRFAILRCLLNGDWRLGHGLYLRSVGLFVSIRRWRLLASLPVLPILAPALYRQGDPHFRDG
jgi:glycosyltransferase involved in cell wall biosynthesis